MPEPGDRVEDRSTYSGCGHVLFLVGDEVRVRFDDGSEEALRADLFEYQTDGFWTV